MNRLKSIVCLTFLSILFINSSLLAQESDSILLRGTIVDGDDPLPGVNIVEAGTTNGTTTDLDGYFELEVSKGADLRLSFIGFENMLIEDVDFSNINVNLAQRLIEFCCINPDHEESHCATTMKELQDLTDQHGCTFK